MLPSMIAGTPCAAALMPILDSTEDHVIPRRNALVGIWAGVRLGYRETELAAYVADVMASDHREVGHRDIVRKLIGDFAERGVHLDEEEILVWLSQAHRAAYRDFLVTD
jgi:hypothetical protein